MRSLALYLYGPTAPRQRLTVIRRALVNLLLAMIWTLGVPSGEVVSRVGESGNLLREGIIRRCGHRPGCARST